MAELRIEILQEGPEKIVEVIHEGPRGVKGDTGETLVLTGPALAGRATGTGTLIPITLGSGLTIANGALTLTGAGAGTVTSVGLSVPTGFSIANSPITSSGTLAVTYAPGYSLPTTIKQGQWDQAYQDLGQARTPTTHKTSHSTGGSDALTPADIGAATAAQGAKADTAVQPADSRLSDAREWSAATVDQATAEAGVSTTRVAYTPLRVFQSTAAWWAASAFKIKLDGIASGVGPFSRNGGLSTVGVQLKELSNNITLLNSLGIVGQDTAPTQFGVKGYIDPLLAQLAPLNSPTFTGTVSGITKAMVGLADVDNTSDASKPISTAMATALAGKADTTDSRLTDPREWSADTISQAESEAGTATTRRAFTAQRVFQSVAAWWTVSAAKTKLDSIASGATANATDAQLRDRSTHTGTQLWGTITDTPTTLGGYGITDGQPLDADLTSIAALTTTSAGRSLLTLSAVPDGALVGTTDTQTLTNKTIGDIKETTFTITDAAGFEIKPANGPIQTITLGANRTPVATNFSSGQSVKLKINNGTAYSITWTTIGVVWMGQTAGSSGTAPALGATGWTHIELWKEGSIVYGSLIGYTAT